MRLARIGNWLALTALVAGCAAKREQAAPGYVTDGYGGEGYGGDYEEAEQEPVSYDDYDAAPMAPPPATTGSSYSASVRAKESRPSRAPKAEPPPPPPPPPPQDAAQPVTLPAEPAAPQPASAPAAARMVHYDGWVRLRVADPRDTLDAVVELAESIGGRVESVSGSVAAIRVPVARFDEAWEDVLALGDVMDRSVRADDVTDAFTSTELRARTLRETLNRLIELLGKAKEEEEKLRLLQQITQVREELDVIESQLRTLSDLAAMSRISVEAVAREAFTGRGGRPDLDGFGWIHAISPFRRAVLADDKRIGLPVPDGLVGLTPRGPFVAESADGAVIWTQQLDNDPVGDGAYWIGAVGDRLAAEFGGGEASRTLGAWTCVTLSEPGADDPYRWDVCVLPVGRKLHLAQVYYPGAEQVERYGPAIDAALAGASSGS